MQICCNLKQRLTKQNGRGLLRRLVRPLHSAICFVATVSKGHWVTIADSIINLWWSPMDALKSDILRYNIRGQSGVLYVLFSFRRHSKQAIVLYSPLKD